MSKVAGTNFKNASDTVAVSYFDMAVANHNALRAIEGTAPRADLAPVLRPGM